MTQTGNPSIDLALGLAKTFAFPGGAAIVVGLAYGATALLRRRGQR